MEVWKDIEGFEGLYQISNQGRVKSLWFGKEKILKGGKARGYLIIGLYKDGKLVMKLVHRLVAEAFLPNPQNLQEVNHKDENKENNNVENLEWCDRKYNCNFGTRNKKIAEKQGKRVAQIDAVTGEVVRQWASTKECGRNGYSHGNVVECCNGLRKTHKGYIWKYINC